MQTLTLLPVEQADRLLDWIIAKRDSGTMPQETFGGKPVNRHALWFGYGVNKDAGIQRPDLWVAYKAKPITNGN